MHESGERIGLATLFSPKTASTAIDCIALFFPLAFFAYLGLKLSRLDGYDSSVLGFSLAAFAAGFALTFPGKRKLDAAIGSLWLAIAFLVQTRFALQLVIDPWVGYAQQGIAHAKLHVILTLVFVLSLVEALLFFLVFLAFPRLKKALLVIGFVTLSALFLAHALVPKVSPVPYIDVFINNTVAADSLAAGRNPYTQKYPDIYRGFYAYSPGFLYFPGTLVWQTPFRFFAGDIRWGFLFAHFLILLSIFKVSALLRKIEWSNLAFASLWLSFPISLFVLEQAWNDTILAALCFFAIWMFLEKRWRTAGIALGLLFSMKQHAFLFPLFGALWAFRNHGRRPALEILGFAAIAFLAVVLPFALADWEAFFKGTIQSHLAAGFRKDAFNLTVYAARELGWMPPTSFQLGMTALGILLGAALILKGQRQIYTFPAGLYLAYAFAFIFGKWAFHNYYYLLASLLLLALLLKMPERPSVNHERP